MGLGVSNWKLASAVAQCGHMGVVSCTAIDEIMIRILQLGDITGNIRRAMSKFPMQSMIQPILDKYFIPGGKSEEEPFKTKSLPEHDMDSDTEKLLMVSNFVEVFLAKENHDGIVGVNYLEKVQIPTLPSLFGAILAGVNCILMGAGIPIAIPGILDKLANWESTELKLNVADKTDDQEFLMKFNPAVYKEECNIELTRPAFLGIVSSDIIARTLMRKSTGEVDGFIIENHHAGGHNAPPRRQKGGDANCYSEKDVPDLSRIKALGKPFWLAGGYANPEKYKSAISDGASGVQLGTPFAFCRESGLIDEIKNKVITASLSKKVDVKTDFSASPTSYPFKLLVNEDFVNQPETGERRRVCDLGYLRQAYSKSDGSLGYRCPAETESVYCSKGGDIEQTIDKKCLCNGLLATIGLGQYRKNDVENPIMTVGDDFSDVNALVKPESLDYSAADVIKYVLDEGKTD